MMIRRAVLPASPEADANPSSSLALLPLLSLSVIVFILLFFIIRMFKRGLHFPNLNLTWLRGKGRSNKGRLGLSGVELLPTSMKSIPAQGPSPFVAAFTLEGNAGHNSVSSLSSRTSSLDTLPHLSTSSPPPFLTSRRRSDSRAPFTLPSFLRRQDKVLHRRSRSLGNVPRQPSSSMPMSAPASPSPKNLLIDFSTSPSSTDSTSSDLGTHKLPPSLPPLIPGIPIPTSSPMKKPPTSRPSASMWNFDDDYESDDITDSRVTDPLLAAFKRSQSGPRSPQHQDSMLLVQYDRPLSPSPSSASFISHPLASKNPFANLADSFTSHSDLPQDPSPTSPLQPSSPTTDIELVPIKPKAISPTTNLVDLRLDLELGATCADVAEPPSALLVDITDQEVVSAPHAEHEAVAIEGVEAVSDPFDDSHAVLLSIDGWDTARPALHDAPEETHAPLVDLIPPVEAVHSVAAQVSFSPSSPPLISGEGVLEEVEKVEVPASPQLQRLSSSWQWDGSWSPTTVAPREAEQLFEPEEDSSAAALGSEVRELRSVGHTETEAVNDHEVDTKRRLVDLEIDVDKEMDPADTWFTEEPTAVWDASWTTENVKGGLLLGADPGTTVDEDDEGHGEQDPINILDELMVEPHESIEVHVFEEIVENSSENSGYDGLETSPERNDNTNDIMPHHDTLNSLIIAASPLLSTPATPNTPLPDLPSPTPFVPPVIVEEFPDPDIMPLPDMPLSAVLPKPSMVLPLHPAQTPTPPASPPPTFNGPIRPIGSIRAADAIALGPSVDTVNAAPDPVSSGRYGTSGGRRSEEQDAKKPAVVFPATPATSMVKSFLILLALVQFATATITLPRRWEDAHVKHSWVEAPRGWRYHSSPSADHKLDMRIALKQDNIDALIANLMETSDPTHSRYGQHLTPAEAEALVGAHPDSKEVINSWLEYHGVAPENISYSTGGGDWVTIRVSVADAERMLNTKYHVYEHSASSERVVRTLSYSLPRDLHDHVDLVSPTTYFGTTRSMRATSFLEPAHADTFEKGSELDAVPSSCNSTITISCLQNLYNTVNYKPSAKNNSLGIVGYLEEFANRADLQTFYSKYLRTAIGSNFTTVLVNNGGDDQSKPGVEVFKYYRLAESNFDTNLPSQANLDIQYAAGLSYPTRNIYYSTGGSPPFFPDSENPTNTNEPYLDWLNFILAQSVVPQTISTSYGDDEQTVPEDYAARVCNLFAQLGATGSTVFFSSGDFGCPFVTAVGGTTKVNPEVAVSFSGGGFSNYFGRPSYQNAAVASYLTGLGTKYSALFNKTGRAYPDIAAQGTSFQVVVGGKTVSVGGTSASAPTVAAIFSLLNDARLAAGKPSLGFINPILYSQGAAGLNDITSGSNPGCNTSGFAAGPGWDPVTGLGTPDFLKLKAIVV
ncbi:hypothetical protein H0H93_011087 [Arthromyces matolae]|nr:hypothetical protein H0H93_011087 [Arthromyces matolae]